ncbi:MAG TPA: DUF2254 domain-containing protein [Vicinamibacterales bacterium]
MASPAGPEPEPTRQTWAEVLSNARKNWREARRHLLHKITWSRLFRLTSYARSALWIVPFFAIVAVMITVPVLRFLDNWIPWDLIGLDVDGARTLFQTVITLTSSFIIFTFGSLLVAIQIAGGQLTPRIIATTLLRDNVVRYSVGLFVFALMFSGMALNRIQDHVHQLVTLLTAVLGVATVVVFLFLIDYAARLLRPGTILARVGSEGIGVIAAVYPDTIGDDGDEASRFANLPETPRRLVTHVGPSETILAVDLDAVMREARRTRGTVELVPYVGDFLATDEPLFVLYGGAMAIDDSKLRDSVAFGPERTIEQDPLFAFRILVDIGLKALSPAINDPTTGVLALDQIHRLLRYVGKRRLRGEVLADGLGHARVIYRTPNWEDFVHIGCTEIRHYGASNVQIARRLRALLDNLIDSLPTHRHQPVKDERDRLDQAIKAAYSISADLALASVPDLQGLGGSTGALPRS